MCRPRTLSLLLLAGLAAVLLAVACRSSGPPEARPVKPGHVERGIASWYGEPFHGRRTASGEVYDMHRFTAAHRTLPFHTRVEVTNLDNGQRVVVRITDRGPFVRGRILDLSYAAARKIGMIGPGTARVEIRVLEPAAPGARTAALPDATDPDPAFGYTVQVGAFQERRRAVELRDSLARRFPDVMVRRQGAWHRVQVGEFRERTAAAELARELARLDLPALVVGIR